MDLRPAFVPFLIIMLASLKAQALCVSAYKANLRKGPGSSYAKSWTVGKYTPLLEVSRKGNWIKVKDQDGQIHWVYGTLVTSRFRCMAVRVNRANVRKGPGTHHPLADLHYADRYSPLKRLDLDGDWYFAETGFGKKFWIHRNNVWRPLKVSRIGF